MLWTYTRWLTFSDLTSRKIASVSRIFLSSSRSFVSTLRNTREYFLNLLINESAKTTHSKLIPVDPSPDDAILRSNC